MLEASLQQLGLSDKEAKTYLASLELGSTAVQEIAKKSGLKRPTVYFTIEQLIEKGLMSSFEKGKKRFFAAESPERLASLIAFQKKKAQTLEENLQRVMPELNNIFDLIGEKPKVRFFEGKEGIRAIQEDILKSKFQSIKEFVPLDEAYKVFPPKLGDHRHKLAKKLRNIPWRMICSTKKGALRPPLTSFFERKFVSPDNFPFSAELVIYGGKIAIVTYRGKLFGVILENREISNSFSAFFNLAWRGIK